ncbi:S41 family peptidase [Metabacillus sediminilitoris]|uniref:C-terminal processing peptidase n=1 Tax=Metabacillus sediminilitoris TaxID=2567941 RepID=A0A4S4C1J2_9BACI|nr:S41 family peptidase [Metabacillus sediminilitoris]QGQ48114.1 PDZ domain-containing protein [Metabacillus sediminilitoris]THF81523.1 PDZ domain-containing protein [Metabacillus sediminilitoris]
MKQRINVMLLALAFVIGAGGMYVGMGYMDHDTPMDAKAVASMGTMFNAEEQASEIEGFDKFKQALELISTRYVEEVDEEELLEGAIQGMLSTLDDPYSVYMDKETAQQFSQSLDSSFEGIGAEVGMKSGKVTIVSPFKGSPAEKAGLQPNDQIISINGENVEGLNLNETVLKIRGKKGTKVKIEVLRANSKEKLSFNVIRDEIPLETVFSSTKDYQGKKVGYIEVTSFSENTAEDFKNALAKLEKTNIEGLVLDVRGNPGGYLQSVEEILKQFVTKDHPYIQIEERNGDKKRYFSTLSKKKDYPVTVLIDKGSASASEILAGALKEASGYKLVGVTSFGKGTVQQAVPMGDGSNIKLTLYKWLTPKGNWIHKKGVEPTIKVEQPAIYQASPIQLEKSLVPDMNNEQVKTAQIILKGLGLAPGREDGYYSKETETAVKAFQETNELPVSGKIDLQTADTLNQKITEIKEKDENDLQLKMAIKALFQ